MNTSKVALVANAALGKILSIIGYIVGTISLLGIIGLLTGADDENAVGGIIFALIIAVICVFLILKGAKIKRTIKRFKQYVALISGQQMTSLENIAASTNQTVDFVTKDLQSMIKRRFFANATIDTTSNEIVIAGKKSSSAAQTKGTAPAEMESYVCAGCEAEGQKPKGASISCDYCGNAV